MQQCYQQIHLTFLLDNSQSNRPTLIPSYQAVTLRVKRVTENQRGLPTSQPIPIKNRCLRLLVYCQMLALSLKEFQQVKITSLLSSCISLYSLTLHMWPHCCFFSSCRRFFHIKTLSLLKEVWAPYSYLQNSALQRSPLNPIFSSFPSQRTWMNSDGSLSQEDTVTWMRSNEAKCWDQGLLQLCYWNPQNT